MTPLLPPVERALITAIDRQPLITDPRPRRTGRLRLLTLLVGIAASASAVAAATGLLSTRTPAPQAQTHLHIIGTTETRALADYRGKPLVVAFYGSWCEPCRKQARTLNAINKRLHRNNVGAAILITVDDLPHRTLAALRHDHLTIPALDDPHKTVSAKYGLTGVPEIFILDPAGNIAYTKAGLATAAEIDHGVRAASRTTG